jgi:hypothetical protein
MTWRYMDSKISGIHLGEGCRRYTELLQCVSRGRQPGDSVGFPMGAETSEWMGNWRQHNWKTSDGKPVANKSPWLKLIEVAETHGGIEWSWVKAYSGMMLNECTDALATREVRYLLSTSPAGVLSPPRCPLGVIPAKSPPPCL